LNLFFLKKKKDFINSELRKTVKTGENMSTFECSICCNEGIAISDRVECQATPCHTSCKDCLTEVLKRQLNIDPNQIKCVGSVDCKSFMHPTSIALLPPDLQKRLHDPVLSGRCKTFTCFVCETNILVPKSQMGVIACPTCLLDFCIKCTQPSHPGQLCLEDEKVNEETENALIKAGAQRCPTCRTPAVRTEACSMMVCECKTSFCDWCGKNLRQEGKLHFCRETINDPPGLNHNCDEKCKHCPRWDGKTESKYATWKTQSTVARTISNISNLSHSSPMDTEIDVDGQLNDQLNGGMDLETWMQMQIHHRLQQQSATLPFQPEFIPIRVSLGLIRSGLPSSVFRHFMDENTS
jgi:E3 ubiquitin-protein ligase RNF144